MHQGSFVNEDEPARNRLIGIRTKSPLILTANEIRGFERDFLHKTLSVVFLPQSRFARRSNCFIYLSNLVVRTNVTYQKNDTH